VGGSFLKVLFGTATVTDLADLHSTVVALSQKQGEVVHALNHIHTLSRWTPRCEPIMKLFQIGH